MDKKIWQWKRTINRQEFLVSSDATLLPPSFVQEAFATDDMYWAKPLSEEETKTMLANSLTLGLYLISSDGTEKQPIGMARTITDFTTFFYLTDVYLQPSHRSIGLGKWLIRACREIVLEFPNLRFMMLVTSGKKAQQLYRKELGMSLVDGQEQPLTCMGARTPKLAEAAAAGPSGSDA